jgi:hypothetical protein
LDAVARTARPKRVRVMKIASAKMKIGTMISTKSSDDVNGNPLILGGLSNLNGSGKSPPLSMLGILILANCNSCATPNVAINNTRRGDENSRRTTPSSMTKPMTAQANVVSAKAIQYGTPYWSLSSAISRIANEPISPWAKLSTPVER